MVESLMYRGKLIRIIEDIRKKKVIFWITVSGNVLTFVSNKQTAIRIAVGFIDVVLGDSWKSSRQGHSDKWKGEPNAK